LQFLFRIYQIGTVFCFNPLQVFYYFVTSYCVHPGSIHDLSLDHTYHML